MCYMYFFSFPLVSCEGPGCTTVPRAQNLVLCPWVCVFVWGVYEFVCVCVCVCVVYFLFIVFVYFRRLSTELH